MIFGFHDRAFSWRSQIFGLAISFEELGRRAAKTQAVCLELGPLCSILEFPSPPSLSPDPPDSLGTLLRARFRRTWHFLWLWRWSVLPPKPGKTAPGTRLDIFYQTAHFFGLKCAVRLYFAQTLLRNAKRARSCQNCRKFCFQHQRCS